MVKWLARVDASPRELELVQQNYSDRFLTIEEHGQEKLIASHRFEACTTALEARDEAVRLLASINVVMELAMASFAGLRFNGVAEHRDGQLHQTIFAELYANLNVFLTAAATVTGGGAAAGAAELPRRSFAERMTELIERDDRVREAALALRVKPVSFPDLYIVYETVKGLMSPTGDRSEWKGLVERGWISDNDSKRFYDTANFYRKGYPREPIKHFPEMLLDDATRLIERLFRRMIDELQPN